MRYNKNQLLQHIERHINKAGSAAAFADKYNLNKGALSAIRNGTYQAGGESMLAKIANLTNYRERNWNIVRSTLNYKTVEKLTDRAAKETMWVALSSKAGSGKTETLQDIYNQDETGSVIYIQAGEWSAREFLLRLAEATAGASKISSKGYTKKELLLEIVCDWLNGCQKTPLLLLDEADKLKPAALRMLIPIYNQTEHGMGAVISGTENLEKEIKKGVRLKKKGYDEIDSRLGRNYISLLGASQKDAEAVCFANGIADKQQADSIWQELDKNEQGFAEDFRRLVRIVKRERFKD